MSCEARSSNLHMHKKVNVALAQVALSWISIRQRQQGSSSSEYLSQESAGTSTSNYDWNSIFELIRRHSLVRRRQDNEIYLVVVRRSSLIFHWIINKNEFTFDTLRYSSLDSTKWKMLSLGIAFEHVYKWIHTLGCVFVCGVRCSMR